MTAPARTVALAPLVTGHWHVIVSQPGYLPEVTPPCAGTVGDARLHLDTEVALSLDALADDCDTSADLAEIRSAVGARRELRTADVTGGWRIDAGGYVHEIVPMAGPPCEED